MRVCVYLTSKQQKGKRKRSIRRSTSWKTIVILRQRLRLPPVFHWWPTKSFVSPGWPTLFDLDRRRFPIAGILFFGRWLSFPPSISSSHVENLIDFGSFFFRRCELRGGSERGWSPGWASSIDTESIHLWRWIKVYRADGRNAGNESNGLATIDPTRQTCSSIPQQWRTLFVIGYFPAKVEVYDDDDDQTTDTWPLIGFVPSIFVVFFCPSTIEIYLYISGSFLYLSIFRSFKNVK